jgi:hypothetical protein
MSVFGGRQESYRVSMIDVAISWFARFLKQCPFGLQVGPIDCVGHFVSQRSGQVFRVEQFDVAARRFD